MIGLNSEIVHHSNKINYPELKPDQIDDLIVNFECSLDSEKAKIQSLKSSINEALEERRIIVETIESRTARSGERHELQSRINLSSENYSNDLEILEKIIEL